MNAFPNQPLSPKYQRLVERFRKQIAEGNLRPGDRLPSLKEIYAQEGISRPTLEKAYAVLEKEELIERQHGAGVFVRQKQEPQREKFSKGVIGLSGQGFQFSHYSAYFASLLGGFREAAESAGLQTLLLDAHSSQGWDKADGVVLCDWNDVRIPRKILPGMPLVSMMTLIKGMASVGADDKAGAYAATQHLLELGHEAIGFVHSYEYDSIAHQRMEGYREAMIDADIRPHPERSRRLHGTYYDSPDYVRAGYDLMKNWLVDRWDENPCSALLCHNDEAAWGVIKALHEAGMRVPQDVAIVGFDGTEFSEMVSPALTTVEIPLREIGAACVEMLLSQIQSETTSDEHRILQPRLKIQDSTGPIVAKSEGS